MVGELFNVDLETLELLDQLERHPVFYTRDTLNVTPNAAPSKPVQCHAYFMRNFRRELLTTEILLGEYRDMPQRPYVLPKDRLHGDLGDLLTIKESHVVL